MFKVDKRQFFFKTMSVSLLGGLLVAIVLCMNFTHATENGTSKEEVITDITEVSTSVISVDPESAAALTSVDPQAGAPLGSTDPEPAATSSQQNQQPQTTETQTDVKGEGKTEEKTQGKAEIKYENFPEEEVKLSLNECKFPGGTCVQECENGVDKRHGDAHYTHHPDNCNAEEEPVPEHEVSQPPACPPFGHRPCMPWSCHRHHNMPHPYNPYHRPAMYHNPYHPLGPSNLSHQCNTGCAGYGFGPQRHPSCGSQDVSRCFLEHSLKNPNAFEKLKNCTFH